MGVSSTVGGAGVADAGAELRPPAGVASSGTRAVAFAAVVLAVFGAAFGIRALTAGKSTGSAAQLAPATAVKAGAVTTIGVPQLASGLPALRKPPAPPKKAATQSTPAPTTAVAATPASTSTAPSSTSVSSGSVSHPSYPAPVQHTSSAGSTTHHSSSGGGGGTKVTLVNSN